MKLKIRVIGLQETRYWVLKINPLAERDPGYMKKLIREIPQFLHFLCNRKLSTQRKSRLWFTTEQIFTEALRKVKADNVNKVEMELYEIINEIMEIKELDAFSFINLNAKILLDRSGHKVSRSRIRKILEDRWGLTQYPNASNFTAFQFDHSGILYEIEAKGRYYTIKKEEMEQIKVAMFT